MNEAGVLASTASRCIWTTYAPGSFYTKALAAVSRTAAAVATSGGTSRDRRRVRKAYTAGKAATVPRVYRRKYL